MRRAWFWATVFLLIVVLGSSAISITAHVMLGAFSQLVSLPLTIVWGAICAYVAFKLAWKQREAG